MATRNYIGARYLPKFYSNTNDGSSEWENGVAYDKLTLVTLTTTKHLYCAKIDVASTVGSPDENSDEWYDIGLFNFSGGGGGGGNELTTADIANNLTTTIAGKVLDARQGKELNDALNLKQDKLTNPLTRNDVIDNLTSTATDFPLSANQGKVLKGLIDNIPNVSVVDNLTSTSTTDALSANQGKELKTLIDGKQDALTNPVVQSDIVDNLTTQDSTKPLSAKQGYVLKGLIDNIPSGGGTTVVDNLTSSSATDALSANQGRVLKGLIDGKQDALTNPLVRADIVNNLTTNDSTKPLSAAQGKNLKDQLDTINVLYSSNGIYLTNVGKNYFLRISGADNSDLQSFASSMKSHFPSSLQGVGFSSSGGKYYLCTFNFTQNVSTCDCYVIGTYGNNPVALSTTSHVVHANFSWQR